MGAIFSGLGFYEIIKRNRLIQDCTEKTEGTADTSISLFTYKADGKKYWIDRRDGSTGIKVVEGAKVTVYYDPRNPKRYYVAESKMNLVIGVILSIVGVIVLVISFMV